MKKQKHNATPVLMDADFSFFFGRLELCPPITRETALRIMNEIETATPDEASCMHRLNATYKLQTRFFPMTEKFTKSELVLIFDYYDGMPCFCDGDKLTNRGRAKLCAENIQSGKCTDKYVREKIGGILFPKIYKQHTEHQK